MSYYYYFFGGGFELETDKSLDADSVDCIWLGFVGFSVSTKFISYIYFLDFI